MRRLVTQRQSRFIRLTGDFRMFPDDFDFRTSIRLDGNLSQPTDQPLEGLGIEIVVVQANSADDAAVVAVLCALTPEYDVIELVAGDGKRAIQAAVGRTTRCPPVMAHLARIAPALSQPTHKIRHAIAHHRVTPSSAFAEDI